jgi:hypothetical protein
VAFVAGVAGVAGGNPAGPVDATESFASAFTSLRLQITSGFQFAAKRFPASFATRNASSALFISSPQLV